MVHLVSVDSDELLDRIRVLFREYAASLNFDLSFQDFETELAALPGNYAPPAGGMIVALDSENESAGCVAFRGTSWAGVCEMKRLFVRPTYRGLGVGKILVTAVIESAANAGYERMRLDTVPEMKAAQGLYRSLGFEEIEAYCHNPIDGAVFLERKLTSL